MKGIFIGYLVLAGLALGTQIMAYMTHKMSNRKHWSAAHWAAWYLLGVGTHPANPTACSTGFKHCSKTPAAPGNPGAALHF